MSRGQVAVLVVTQLAAAALTAWLTVHLSERRSRPGGPVSSPEKPATPAAPRVQAAAPVRAQTVLASAAEKLRSGLLGRGPVGVRATVVSAAKF
jgi:hypothetical protein